MADRSVITIGNFDGVHLGHRTIVQKAQQLGRQHDCSVTAVTFDPHPAAVLRPGTEPPVLTDRIEKIAALRAVGVDQVVVLETTRDLLSLGPDAFLHQVIDAHAPVAMVEGPDFRFGKDRAGDVEALRSVGSKEGFQVHVIARVQAALSDQHLVAVSSSLVRWLLAHGRVDDAARCLGAPYPLSGCVVAGDKRGATIGFPTVNLDPAAVSSHMVPVEGVYAGAVTLPDGSDYPAAISVGHQPTFDGANRVVEAHLLDFTGDLYGQTVTIGFHRWLRDQRPFSGLEQLRGQLDRDVAQTRQWHEMALVGTEHRTVDRATAR